MRVVLVHTGISRCGFNSYGTSQESSWISHGLCSLSSYAKSQSYAIELIDLRRLKGWNHFKQELLNLSPDVIGYTMMTVDFEIVRKAIACCREVLPKVKIVIGGPHPSILPEDVNAITDVDYVIRGEGEISFVNLLNCISKDEEFPRMSIGITPDLNDLPHPDRSLYPSQETPFHSSFPVPFITLITGRGCMYNCSFCQPAERMIFGRKVRRRSVDNVMSELKEQYDLLDFNSFMIHDDCFTEDERYVQEFCEKYSQWRINKPFICQTRADIICKNTDTIRQLRNAGCRMFSIGFESGNDRILKLLRKGVKAEQNYRAAELCRELDILIDANYMLGMPTETEDEMMDTVRMINAINPEIRSPSFFTPHIGTDLYDYCAERNLLIAKDYSGFRRNPYGKKIRGVNYKTVKKMLWLSRGEFNSSHIKLYISDHPKLYKAIKWVTGSI